MKESPLVIFTLASQAAAGAYAILAGLQWVAGAPAGLLDLRTLAVLSLLVLLGMAASLFHLGAPLEAYRALCSLRSSWLSREILAAALFAGCLVAQTGAAFLWGPERFLAPLVPLVALAGLGLVYCMGRAYMLRTMAPWDTPAVLLSFLATTAVLGSLAALVPAAGGAYRPALLWVLSLAAATDIALGLWRLRAAPSPKYGALRAPARRPEGRRAPARLRAGLAAVHAGLLILGIAWAWWALAGGLTPLPALALVLAAEVAGRVRFYQV